MKTNKLSTIYVSGEFLGSIQKIEAEVLEYGTKKYAQYNNAPFVTFIPPKKRNPRIIGKSYKPFLLILDGTGHPEPDALFTPPVPGNIPGITVLQSRYSSFDDRWESDFDKMMDQYMAEKNPTVIADFRHTKGFNSN